MNGLVKSGAVLAGYIAALLVASAAVAIRIARTDGPDVQASAGMYAFGDGLLFLAVFAVAAIVPTGMALRFLRPCRLFWTALSIAALTVAATGIAAASVHLFAFPGTLAGSWAVWAALAVLRMLAAPLLAPSFALAGIMGPTPATRRALLLAAAIEGAVAAYSILLWFAPYRFT